MADYLPHTDAEVAAMLGLPRARRRSTSCSPPCPPPCGWPAAWTWPTACPSPTSSPTSRTWPTANRARSDRLVCFAGGGAYDHEVPPVVRALAGALGVRHLLHALPARGGPGRPPGGLRVPDHGGPPGRAAGGQRLALRRGQRAGRGGQPGRGGRRAPRRCGSRPGSTRTGGPVLATFAAGTGHRPGRGRPARRARPAWPEPRRAGGAPGVVVVRLPQLPGLPGGPGRGPAPVRPPRGPAGGGRRPGGRRDPALAGRRGGPTWWWGRARPSGPALGFGGPYLGLFACTLDQVRRLPGPPGRRDRRRRGPPGLRDHPAGPRAGHPPGEGDVQRLHQPDPDGGDRRHPAGLAGHLGPGRGGAALRPRAPATAAPGPARPRRGRAAHRRRPRWCASSPCALPVPAAGGGRAPGRRGLPGRHRPRRPGRRRRRRLGAARRRRARPAGGGDRAADPRPRSTPSWPPSTRRCGDDGGHRRRRGVRGRRPPAAGRPAPRCWAATPSPPSSSSPSPGRRSWQLRTTGVPEWRLEELVPAEHRRADAGGPGRGVRARPGGPLHPAQPPPVLGRPRGLPARARAP